jgi:hypothetical protein
MALMVRELYDALLAAGVSEEQAGKAAEAVAQWESRLGKLEADLGLLKWMVGVNITLTLFGFAMVGNWLWQVLQRLPPRP